MDLIERLPSFDRTPSATVKTVERLYNEGVRMKHLGDNEEAERCFREALRRKSDYVPAMMGLGGLLKEMERDEEGLEYIMQATNAIVNPPTLKGERPTRKAAPKVVPSNEVAGNKAEQRTSSSSSVETTRASSN